MAAFCVHICLPHFAYANNNIGDNVIRNYIRATAYRRADLLCYTATYYGFNPRFNGLIRQVPAELTLDIADVEGSIYDRPLYYDSKYRAGMMEWFFIDQNSLRSAFLDLDLKGGSQRDRVFSYTSYVNTLVDSIGFKRAIEDCAKRKNLEFEDLFEGMRSLILKVDNNANWFGRIAQFSGIILIGDMILMGVIRGFTAGFRMVKPFVLRPEVRAWLLQTRAFKTLKDRVAFFQRYKIRIGLGTLGIAVLSTTTIGDSAPYFQIHQENATQISNDDAQIIADDIRQMFPNNDNFQQLWNRRFQESNDERLEGQYREIVRISARLQNLKGTNGESSPLYQELHRRLHIRINLYFVDYWIVHAALNYFRENKENLGLLNAVTEMFAFRKMQLEDQAEMTSERSVALELLDLSQNDESFTLCDFNGISNAVTHRSRSNLLCKAHLLYTLRKYNGVYFSEEQAVELEQLEIELFH